MVLCSFVIGILVTLLLPNPLLITSGASSGISSIGYFIAFGLFLFGMMFRQFGIERNEYVSKTTRRGRYN